MCKHYECPSCKAAQRFQLRPIASSEPLVPTPGKELGCDSFYCTHPRRAYHIRGTLCADYGSRFTTCHVLNKEEMDKNCGNTTAEEMKETVLKSWIQHYGEPEVLRSDLEGCFDKLNIARGYQVMELNGDQNLEKLIGAWAW
eukprot:519193-Pyramimonas_sp.AAC.1